MISRGLYTPEPTTVEGWQQWAREATDGRKSKFPNAIVCGCANERCETRITIDVYAPVLQYRVGWMGRELEFDLTEENIDALIVKLQAARQHLSAVAEG